MHVRFRHVISVNCSRWPGWAGPGTQVSVCGQASSDLVFPSFQGVFPLETQSLRGAVLGDRQFLGLSQGAESQRPLSGFSTLFYTDSHA